MLMSKTYNERSSSNFYSDVQKRVPKVVLEGKMYKNANRSLGFTCIANV